MRSPAYHLINEPKSENNPGRPPIHEPKPEDKPDRTDPKMPGTTYPPGDMPQPQPDPGKQPID